MVPCDSSGHGRDESKRCESRWPRRIRQCGGRQSRAECLTWSGSYPGRTHEPARVHTRPNGISGGDDKPYPNRVSRHRHRRLIPARTQAVICHRNNEVKGAGRTEKGEGIEFRSREQVRSSLVEPGPSPKRLERVHCKRSLHVSVRLSFNRTLTSQADILTAGLRWFGWWFSRFSRH